jgi:site-specific DNA recombinase
MARSSAPRPAANGSNGHAENRVVRCAIYTRKSTEEGLQQDFNSLDAQREAAEAFITSQRGEGWQVVADHFDDGGYTGANMDRPALKPLLAMVESRSVDCVVVYKDLRHRDQLRREAPLDCSATPSAHGREVNGHENGETNGNRDAETD